MRIQSINIQNFRSNRSVNICFDNIKNKDFHIFHLINTCGKSSFINALYWCLYKTELINCFGDLITPNLNIIQEALQNGHNICNVSVEIKIEESGKVITFKRNSMFDFDPIKETSNTFTITVEPESSEITTTYVDAEATKIIEIYFDKNLIQYSFNEAEYISNNLNTHQDKEKLKYAINHFAKHDNNSISQADRINEIINSIENKATNIFYDLLDWKVSKSIRSYNIKICCDFSIALINETDNGNCLDLQAAEENYILNLSILLAINELFIPAFPLFLTSPFNRNSDETTKLLLDKFIEMSSKRQICILTDYKIKGHSDLLDLRSFNKKWKEINCFSSQT